jgi:hypothetical protein
MFTFFNAYLTETIKSFNSIPRPSLQLDSSQEQHPSELDVLGIEQVKRTELEDTVTEPSDNPTTSARPSPQGEETSPRVDEVIYTSPLLTRSPSNYQSS